MRDVMSSPRAKAAVRLALDEDLGNALRVVSGAWLDATSEALVDPEAVAVATENAAKNGVKADFDHFALGRGRALPGGLARYDVVAANILGPLLVRFADEIAPCVGGRLIVSGILNELYPEVLAAYEARGFRELDRTTLGEWTTGLLAKSAGQ